MRGVRWACGGLLAVGLGCSVVTEPSEDLCAQADEHVAACLDAPTSPAASEDCDPQAAADLLDLSCEQIAGGKADGFTQTLLCAAGSLRHCEVPACNEALPEDHDFGDSDCLALIDEPGCGACDYYRCREAQSIGACGDDGYYQGFGYKYCLRYAQVTEPRMSAVGQAWSAQTRRCLIEALDTEIEDTDDCASLVEQGYDSHPQCYEDTGFCDLSPADWLRVLSTIDHADRDLSLSVTVGLECLGS